MSLVDIIFPKHCLNCNQIGSYICPTCLPTLQRHTQICIVCRKPSPHGATHTYCQSYSHINNLIIACIYKDTLRTAIHKIKYKFAYDIIDELCEKTLKSEKIKRFLHEAQISYITEIPAHPHKQNARGFNVPTHIAQWLAKTYHIPYQQFLEKKKQTAPQVNVHHRDRIFNVQNSFEMMNVPIHDKARILIVDDILTTGSTLEEAAKVISQQQPVQVLGLALASSH